MGKLKTLPGKLATLKPNLGHLAPIERTAAAERTIYSPWRKWYNTKRWRQMRWARLVADAFTCTRCGRLEGDTSQLVCDHKVPHRGSEALFWDEANLTTLCKPCHDGAKQRDEQRPIRT